MLTPRFFASWPEMAACCAGALDPDTERSLDAYATDIGLAFQVRDDILDVEASTHDLGKTAGADAARSKPTYPSILGLKAAKARAEELKLSACGHLSVLGSRASVRVPEDDHIAASRRREGTGGEGCYEGRGRE
jgi:geranylgeranyl pyrophosphate synthase